MSICRYKNIWKITTANKPNQNKQNRSKLNMTTQFSVLQASESMGMRYIGVEELAAMIGRAISTVRTQASREPWKLPPQPANKTTNQVQWLLATVWKWMSEQPVTSASTPIIPAPSPLSSSQKKRRGAPSSTEKLAAKNAGMSVTEFRRANSSSHA